MRLDNKHNVKRTVKVLEAYNNLVFLKMKNHLLDCLQAFNHPSVSQLTIRES